MPRRPRNSGDARAASDGAPRAPSDDRPGGECGARGVSPVIGVVLMVAIVVVLASLVGVMALGFDDSLVSPPPHVSFEADYDPTGEGNDGKAYVNVSHVAGDRADGDRIVIRDSAGNEVAWETIWTAGDTASVDEYVHVDGSGNDCALDPITEGEVYRVVWFEEEGGSGHVIETVEIDEPPANAPDPDDFDDDPWTC